MTDSHTSIIGSFPEYFDQYLGFLLDLMDDASNQAYSELAKLVKTS